MLLLRANADKLLQYLWNYFGTLWERGGFERKSNYTLITINGKLPQSLGELEIQGQRIIRIVEYNFSNITYYILDLHLTFLGNVKS